MFEGVLRQTCPDPGALVIGVDPDDLDRTHPLVEGVQSDRHEPDRATIVDRDEHIAVVVRAGGPNRLGLTRTPVGMQAKEDLVTEHHPDRREDRFPRAQRKGDDGVEVVVDEPSYVDRVIGHSDARR